MPGPAETETAICAACQAVLEPGRELCPACEGSTLLDGRFSLREVLGRSGARATYRAVRVEDGRPVAIKELLVRGSESVKALQLFEREVEVLRQLEHPAIPRLFEGFTVPHGKRAGLYLVRELIEGESLAETVARRPPSLAEAAEIAADLLEVLAYLHALRPPVVHRDLTPANVLRQPDGTLALVDFGSVRAAATPDGSTIAGTFGAMAPEQLRGRATPASDIYAVGALVLSLVTGRPADALVGPRYRLDVGAHLPAGEVRSLVERMLQPDPDARPRSAGALARRMRSAAQAPARPPTRAVPWVLGAALLGAVSVGIGALAGGPSSTEAAAGETTPPPNDVEPAPAPPAPGPSPIPTAPGPPVPMPSTGLPPSEPAPLPEGFRPVCEPRGDCRSVADGFAGLALDEACRPLVEPGRAPPTGSRLRGARPLVLGGVTFSCTPHQQHGRFCNVLCTATPPDPWTSAEDVLRWVGDRHGAPDQSDERGRRRTWTWRSGEPLFAPELLVLAERSVGPGRLTVSYRGGFDGRGR